jgi:hypothetical protein
MLISALVFSFFATMAILRLVDRSSGYGSTRRRRRRDSTGPSTGERLRVR